MENWGTLTDEHSPKKEESNRRQIVCRVFKKAAIQKMAGLDFCGADRDCRAADLSIHPLDNRFEQFFYVGTDVFEFHPDTRSRRVGNFPPEF